MTAYVFCGGEFFADGFSSLEPCDFAIAADSGMYAALNMDIVPQLFIGDFDSFDVNRLSTKNRRLVQSIKTMTYPVKKDLTDSMIAIEAAVERGADNIVILGALGGRLDHTLSNVFMLKNLRDRDVTAVIDNGRNAVRYIHNEAIKIKKRYKYISLLALDGDASGVSISGVEYPLDNAVLKSDFPYAVSNRISGDECSITVKDGGLLVVESHE